MIEARRTLLLVAAWALSACSRRSRATAQAIAAGATVLALGDSITAGVGAASGEDYPALLAAATGWQVINGGRSGDTASHARERLPGLLAEHKPALVIVSLGGNDFLRRIDRAQTEQALRESAQLARGAGAQMLLVAVPQPSLGAALGVGLADHPLYDKLAQELALPLHAGGWARVLGDDKLRSDQIHANAAGYRAFTDGLVATLRSTGLLR